MIRFWAHRRQTTSLSALLALFVFSGCALPPQLGFANRSDAALSALTLSPPPELVREPRPYPTAVPAGAPLTTPLTRVLAAEKPIQSPDLATAIQSPQIPAPLPPPTIGSQPAIPLDRQVHQGRMPNDFGQAVTPPVVMAAPDQVRESRYEGGGWIPANNTITLEASPSASLVNGMFSTLEKSLPVNDPPASLSTVLYAPVNIKPQPPQFDPPAFHNHLPPSATPPSPAEPPSEPAADLCKKLIVSLEQEIRARTDRKEEDALPALHQKLRLLQLVADHSDDAVDQVEQLPPAEREAFKQLMFALTTWLSPEEAKRTSSRNAKILRSLHEANNRLSAVSKLDLKNLMFCEKVESFGWYTEFQRAEFAPKQQVILYVEVQNFAAEEKTTTAFETELQGSYQIFDASGNIVDERQLPLDREVCRNYRRDYFLAYRIYLPAELAAGRYRLELTIEDLKAKKDFKGRKQGEAMIEFGVK